MNMTEDKMRKIFLRNERDFIFSTIGFWRINHKFLTLIWVPYLSAHSSYKSILNFDEDHFAVYRKVK